MNGHINELVILGHSSYSAGRNPSTVVRDFLIEPSLVVPVKLASELSGMAVDDSAVVLPTFCIDDALEIPEKKQKTVTKQK